MDHTFDTTGPVELEVELRDADLRITAADTSTTTVEIRTSGDTDPSEVAVTRHGDTIHVNGTRARRGGWFGRRGIDEVVVTVPRGSTVRARTGSGDVVLSGDLGRVRASTGSGDISAEALPGESRLTTGSGDLRVTHATGDVELRTGSGDIDVRTARGTLALKAGSGDVTVAAAHDGASVTTGSGDVALHSVHAGEVWLRTGSGDASVSVPQSVPVWTDASAQGGVDNRLTPRGKPEDAMPFVSVRAQLGSGSLRLLDA